VAQSMLSNNLKQQLFACCVLNNLFETCLLKAQCEGPCSNKNILSAVGSCCVLFRSQTAYFASLENFQRVLLLWNVQSTKSVWTAYWFSFGTILMFFFVFVATCDLVCVFFWWYGTRAYKRQEEIGHCTSAKENILSFALTSSTVLFFSAPLLL